MQTYQNVRITPTITCKVIMVDGDAIASAVLEEFSKLPAKRKPSVRDNGLHEWVPMAGIVAKGAACYMPRKKSKLLTDTISRPKRTKMCSFGVSTYNGPPGPLECPMCLMITQDKSIAGAKDGLLVIEQV